MLSNLHIENVAVIENAELTLGNGFNVLTGETGAGKSILIDSINLALGERVSRDIVRTGTEKAFVSAMFQELSDNVRRQIRELGFSCEEDGSLLVQREISAEGKSTCRVSGRPATISMLRSVGRLLVNIHGQHDNQTLMSPEKHIVYLDRYAQIGPGIEAYRDVYDRMRKAESEISRLQTDEAMKERRIDLLTYQIQEIEDASLRPGEEEELQARKMVVLHAEKIAEGIHQAYADLSGEGAESDYESRGAQELLSDAAGALQAILPYYPDIKELSDRVASLSYELEDCLEELRQKMEGVEQSPEDPDAIEERLDLIFRLKRKYGGTIEEILSFLDVTKTELEKIETSDVLLQKYRKEWTAAREETLRLAAGLHQKRMMVARRMEEQIKSELRFLDMPGVAFTVDIAQKDPGPDGADKVEFLISANPGSPPRPLARIASGGEISRIMLAIKNVLAGNDEIETLIFDEIDTGVSGRAAQKIGMKLKQVSKGKQVICVTHLAQIAAQADHHILIEKHIENGNTFTRLKNLDAEGRKYELARIIGGANLTELTLKNAQEMLAMAAAPPEKEQSGC